MVGGSLWWKLKGGLEAAQTVLRWFVYTYLEIIYEQRMAINSGWQVQGRPKFGWMDDAKMALGSRGLSITDERSACVG